MPLAGCHRGAGENRRSGMVRLDQVFQAQQIREGRRKNRRAVGERHAVGERINRGRARAGVEAPRAVTGRRIFEQHPLAGGRFKAALRPRMDRLRAWDRASQRWPVQTEIGRHARVGRDAQIILQEERVDGGHGKIF